MDAELPIQNPAESKDAAHDAHNEKGNAFPKGDTGNPLPPVGAKKQCCAQNTKNKGLDGYNSFVATATLVAVIWYACIAHGQLNQMRDATVAATHSANTAKETMLRSQRPWIGNEGSGVKIKILNTNMVAGNMMILAKNFGPSPALNMGVGAFPFIRSTASDDSDFSKAREKACAEADTNALILGDSLFPQQASRYDAIVLSAVEGIEKRDRMLFAGCISYRDQFDITHPTHHTSFCVMGAIKHLDALYNCGTGEIAN